MATKLMPADKASARTLLIPKSSTGSVFCLIYDVHCPLSTFHFSPSTVHCPLSTFHCLLFNVHLPLSTVHFSPPTVHCPHVNAGRPLSTVVACSFFNIYFHCALATVHELYFILLIINTYSLNPYLFD